MQTGGEQSSSGWWTREKHRGRQSRAPPRFTGYTVLSFQNAYAARHRTLFSAHPLPRISTTNTRMDQCTRKHFRTNTTSSIESQYTGVVTRVINEYTTAPSSPIDRAPSSFLSPSLKTRLTASSLPSS